MKSDALQPLPVMHLMRTYGAHGGEQQLSQYFGAEPSGDISETFVFVYRDTECAQLFMRRAPKLDQVDLLPAAVATGSAWGELAKLLPLLPFLQFRFLNLIRRRRPAVCVVHGFQGALVAWPAAMVFRKTRWAYVHRITKSATGSNALFRLIYRPFDVLAGNSKAVTASLAPLTQDSRLATLDNGLDWRAFDARAKAGVSSPVDEPSGPVIVSVGRLLPHKGQAMIIDAFDIIANEFADAELWIVGNGTEIDKLRIRAAASPVAERIHLLGRREDVPAVLMRADVFVNASTWEGMSNAVLEGMAAGLPSVVADAPGVTECHVNGITGFVVQHDAQELALGIAKLLADPNLARRMGDAALSHVRTQYSMEACRKRYLDLFGRLTGCDVCAES
jgi:glycosyltransferase involved in cell wall biosynthesis